MGPAGTALDLADDGGHESLVGRLASGRRRNLSIHALESCMPEALSRTGGISCATFAPRHGWRIDHGAMAWRVLFGLLLVLDVAAFCARCDEPALDCRPDLAGVGGEDSAPNAVGAANRWRSPLRMGLMGAC